MSEWAATGSFEEKVELSSLQNIKANGISIRVNGQIVKFMPSEVQDVTVEEEIRLEMKSEYDKEVKKLRDQFESLKSSVTSQMRTKNAELDRRERDLKELARATVSLPPLNSEQVMGGLSVAKHQNGYLWVFNCVYAPRFMNNKAIDPNFVKRLMTPIRLFVFTNLEWKTTEVKLMKLMSGEKFEHYHSYGDRSDCWGQFKSSGLDVSTADKAMKLMKDCQKILETINRMSIGNRAPKGLPRLSTLEKHVLNDSTVTPTRTESRSSRNERVGFDETVNADVAAELWQA